LFPPPGAKKKKMLYPKLPNTCKTEGAQYSPTGDMDGKSKHGQYVDGKKVDGGCPKNPPHLATKTTLLVDHTQWGPGVFENTHPPNKTKKNKKNQLPPSPRTPPNQNSQEGKKEKRKKEERFFSQV